MFKNIIEFMRRKYVGVYIFNGNLKALEKNNIYIDKPIKSLCISEYCFFINSVLVNLLVNNYSGINRDKYGLSVVKITTINNAIIPFINPRSLQSLINSSIRLTIEPIIISNKMQSKVVEEISDIENSSFLT